ncbi:MAG: hypothetical protein K0U98_26880 [Deltaproteobacteria bacterium]|nr:hypothetical protein [Deltaproteobacteria bacterium]
MSPIPELEAATDGGCQGFEVSSIAGDQGEVAGDCGSGDEDVSDLTTLWRPGLSLDYSDPATPSADSREVGAAIGEYMEFFYNRHRHHSWLGFQSPADCEEA